MAANHARYGFLTIGSIALWLLTGLPVSFADPGHVICSQLGAAGLGMWQWRSNSSRCTPAHMAEAHGVHAAQGSG